MHEPSFSKRHSSGSVGQERKQELLYLKNPSRQPMQSVDLLLRLEIMEMDSVIVEPKVLVMVSVNS